MTCWWLCFWGKIDNGILQSTRCNRDYQIEIKEPNKNDFASNDTKDDLDEKDEIKLVSIKIYKFFKLVFGSNLIVGIEY